ERLPVRLVSAALDADLAAPGHRLLRHLDDLERAGESSLETETVELHVLSERELDARVERPREGRPSRLLGVDDHLILGDGHRALNRAARSEPRARHRDAAGDLQPVRKEIETQVRRDPDAGI